MYGKPLDPKKTSFMIIDTYGGDEGIMIGLVDLEEPDNDGIRDVDHPDFERMFGNDMECVFSSNPDNGLETEEDVKNWLLSIGMVEEQDQ